MNSSNFEFCRGRLWLDAVHNLDFLKNGEIRQDEIFIKIPDTEKLIPRYVKAAVYCCLFVASLLYFVLLYLIEYLNQLAKKEKAEKNH